jgi:BASS family bile acid:Na+ symporter
MLVVLKVVSALMLVSLMLGVGLQSDRAHLATVLKNYSLLGRALLANVVIVPFFGVILARTFQLDDYIATGFLLMAIAPGVPFVALAGGRKKGGSLSLAETLSIILPAVSIVTIPLTAEWVLPAHELAELPIRQFVMTLVVFQLLPLLAGIYISFRSPQLAEALAKPQGLFFIVSLLVLLIFLSPELVKSVATVYGTRGILAMVIIVVLSIVTGWLLGGPDLKFRRTLGIGTALRNVGSCAVIATENFSNTPVVPTVMTYFIVQCIVCVIVGVYFTRTAEPVAPAAT